MHLRSDAEHANGSGAISYKAGKFATTPGAVSVTSYVNIYMRIDVLSDITDQCSDIFGQLVERRIDLGKPSMHLFRGRQWSNRSFTFFADNAPSVGPIVPL